MPGVIPLAREEAGVMLCEVLWVDRFGNCQLNVEPDEVEHWGDRLACRSATAPHRRCAPRRSSRTSREIGTARSGSSSTPTGMLALRSTALAAEELGIGAGDQVVLEPFADDDGDDGSRTTSPVTLRRSR
jgi:S-adenosylmethionine hydrolase